MATANTRTPLLIAAVLLVTSLVVTGCSEKVEMATADNQKLSNALPAYIEQANLASSANLNKADNVASEQLITDNDKAFQSKLEMIAAAEETLDLMYFIYATDESSAVMTAALLEAARDRGVKVRLLLDYLTNYHNLDYFRMMEREGAGNLEVRFYGRPTGNIIKDALYLTMKCENGALAADCNKEKFRRIADIFAAEEKKGSELLNLNHGLSGLFLSGLYAKNPEVMALAILAGQELDALDATGSQEMSAEDKAGLQKIARLIWAANTGSTLTRLRARVELGLAKMLYGEQVVPIIDGTYNLLPLGNAGHYSSAQDWQFISDYLHMKIIAADGRMAQLGGRNVENSYHIDSPALSNGDSLTGKYIFMDTDMLITLKQPDQAIRNAFSRVWEFKELVATLGDVGRHAPNDFLVNLDMIKKQIQQNECQAEFSVLSALQQELGSLTDKEQITTKTVQLKTGKKTFDSCLTAALPGYWNSAAALRGQTERLDQARQAMQENAETYLRFYTPKADYQAGVDVFPIDPAKARTYYLENTPFQKGANSFTADSASARLSGRKFGVQNGREAESGKEIHAVWLQGLQQTCAASRLKPAGEKTTIVLHNAYFLLPSNLLQKIADMVKDEACSQVNIQVLTNSIFTTDLNIINLVSRHALKAFADYYRQVKTEHPDQGATVEYFEYATTATGTGPSRSLHSKVTLFGDSCMLVGSANADVRSYMMDANNGFLFCLEPNSATDVGQPSAIDNYKKFLADILAQRASKTDVIAYAERSREELLATDYATLEAMGAKYRAERWLSEEQTQQFIADMKRLLDSAYDLSLQSLSTGDSAEAAEEFNSLFKAL